MSDLIVVVFVLFLFCLFFVFYHYAIEPEPDPIDPYSQLLKLIGNNGGTPNGTFNN